MATIAADDLKAELMSRGIWADFVRLREDLSSEMPKFKARLEAVKRLAPDLEYMIRPKGRPKNCEVKKAADCCAVDVDQSGVEAKSVVRAAPDKKMSQKDAKYASGECRVKPLVSRDVFGGRRCSLSKAFMWAYSNLCIEGVSPEEAPSAVAWQMYIDMMSSPSMKAEMLKSGLSAAMRKAESEEESGDGFDGEAEYDVLKAITGGS